MMQTVNVGNQGKISAAFHIVVDKDKLVIKLFVFCFSGAEINAIPIYFRCAKSTYCTRIDEAMQI
jgi:hypothetical protein